MMGDSMTSMKSSSNNNASEIKAAAEAELAELSSQKSGSTRQKSNPRLLKPIAVADQLNANNNSLMQKKKEQKRLYNELSKEISAVNEGMIKGAPTDIMKDIQDAFSVSSKPKTQAEKKLATKAKAKPAEPEPEASETSSVQEMDPKALRREELKRKAMMVGAKSRGTLSDTSSIMSDMSYQSDISGLQRAFITSTRQPPKPKPRPTSALKIDNLEPIEESH